MKTILFSTVCLAALSLAAIPRLGAQTPLPLTVLHSFGAFEDDDRYFNSDGANPQDALALGNDGNFYGTTPNAGEDGGGTVFRITPAGAFTLLHLFELTVDQTTGAFFSTRANGLARGADGNFYGTTDEGGGSHAGTIFRITPGGGFANLYGFNSSDANGYAPAAALVLAADGNFYGTTAAGGPGGGGTVFRLTPAGAFTRLHAIGGSDDAGSPEAVLAQGRDGNFYGTTAASVNGSGTIFKVTSAGVLTTLHQFAAFSDGFTINTDGAQPTALVLGNDGNFYGAGTYGGSDGEGTIYRITPAGVFTLLHDFKYPEDGHPTALTLGPDGNFYGRGFNSIFRVTPEGVVTTLHVYGDGEGNGYGGALVRGRDGNFYGVTSGGGSNGNGTVFRLEIVPIITSAATATGTGGVPFSYQITATGEATTYGATGLPTGLSVSAQTGLISGTPQSGGTFVVTISAANAFGKGSATLTLSLAATGSPYITSAPSLAVAEDTAFSYQITAMNNPTSFGVEGLPSGVTVDAKTGLISGRHHGLGTVTLSLHAFNDKGEGSAPLTFQVYGAPIITSAATAKATDEQPFSYQITARNAPTAYGVENLPDGLSVDRDTGLISGTHKGVGKVKMTLNAYNGAGKGSASLTLSVSK